MGLNADVLPPGLRPRSTAAWIGRSLCCGHRGARHPPGPAGRVPVPTGSALPPGALSTSLRRTAPPPGGRTESPLPNQPNGPPAPPDGQTAGSFKPLWDLSGLQLPHGGWGGLCRTPPSTPSLFTRPNEFPAYADLKGQQGETWGRFGGLCSVSPSEVGKRTVSFSEPTTSRQYFKGERVRRQAEVSADRQAGLVTRSPPSRLQARWARAIIPGSPG